MAPSAFWGWVALLSIVAFALMGVDKWRAARGGWRIRERDLLLAALAGGTPGTVLGIVVWRHKTRKARFLVGLAAVALAQAAILYLWLG